MISRPLLPHQRWLSWFINPLLLFTVGFQLSYAATLSLITFTPVLTEKISLLFSRTVCVFVSGEDQKHFFSGSCYSGGTAGCYSIYCILF
ncbi:MAG: ComEC/Rec2 family competence protein [Dethiobacteria bacterium]